MDFLTLHPFQAEALRALRAARVNLALTAPTGAGKGVILEILARDPHERILIFSPLLALARQQRLRFAAQGTGERVRILSPESAFAREQELRDWAPTLIAVDEAHCLVEWGKRFRPAYGRLLEFVRDFDVSRTLWMSATFPRPLFAELELKVGGAWTRIGEFAIPERLETRATCVPAADRIERVREAVETRRGPGLLFCGTRKDVGRYLRVLAPARRALPYHAGLSDEERRTIEGILETEGKTNTPATTIVATNAFGMGMNFPQFEWAILASVPYSLVSLMQAFGRVARGNRAGTADLYWCEEDFRFAGLLIGAEGGTLDELGLLRRYLESDSNRRREITREAFL